MATKKKKISSSTASKSYNQKTIAKMKARDAGKSSSTSSSSKSTSSSTTVSSGKPIDTNYQMKAGESASAYKARVDAYNTSKNATPVTKQTTSPSTTAPVSSGNPVDTNLYLKQGETPDQYKARTEAYNASKNTPQPTDAGQNTSGFSDLKSLSIAKTPPSNTQQSPEDWAKAFMDTMSQNNPDTSGVGTQSTQGDAEAGTTRSE